MLEYSQVQWLFLFYCFSLFGWCFESTYVSFLKHKFVNRGFMRGPFLPLYGCGGIMMLAVSGPFSGNILVVFVAGCIGATILEYITGVLMEKLFKVRYWDYSDQKFNFQGQICLSSTLMWGVLTVFFTMLLRQFIADSVATVPENVIRITDYILTIYVSIDFAFAFKAALELRDILVYMDKVKDDMRRMQNRLDAIIAFSSDGIEKRRDAGMEKVGVVVESLSRKAGSVKDGLTGRVTSAGSQIENHLDALSSGLESRFSGLKENMQQKPAYFESVRDEITELRTRYRVMLEELPRPSLKGFSEAYKRAIIKGNPGMVSAKFRESLEELKERMK